MDLVMAINLPDQKPLTQAFSIIEGTPEIEVAIGKLRDLLNIDHVVYHSSKFGASPSVDPYIRLTYPASWIKRYLQMGYVDVDPVLREGFRRTLPFNWNELTIQSATEASFLADALSHGVGPHGFSVPVVSKLPDPSKSGRIFWQLAGPRWFRLPAGFIVGLLSKYLERIGRT
jgi:hypothetical protein